jgi:ATP-dependent DNA helicase DinG
MSNHNSIFQIVESACQDTPVRPSFRVEDGHFVAVITGREKWEATLKLLSVPAQAVRTEVGETLTVRWPSHADAIFAADGLLAQHLDAYEVRPQQLHMGRLVQRSIEMGEPAVVEGGTGTGKSFAYAAICMAMGKRVVISTSNKALQMQLYRKDIPLLRKLYPGQTVALAVGKGNYVCRARVQDDFDGTLKLPNMEMVDWYNTTPTGNTEEIPFAVDWQTLADITVDDNCTGKMCPHWADCFYYNAKQERMEADVVITNHALLCLHQLYPHAGLLPDADVTVVDEAHKLPDYARNALGEEMSLGSLERTVNLAAPFTGAAHAPAIDALVAEVLEMVAGQKYPQPLGIGDARILGSGAKVAEQLEALANEVWDNTATPGDPSEVRAAKVAQRIRNKANQVWAVSQATRKGHVRWIEPDKDDWKRTSVTLAPYNVSAFIAALAGVGDDPVIEVTGAAKTIDHTYCTRCHRTLTAATVAILNGHPYGPDCIEKVDILGDAERVPLNEWLAMDHEEVEAGPITIKRQPVIFTSATLAAPDMAHFLRTCGLPDALQMQVASPFDYQNNALLYVPNAQAPGVKAEGYLDWMTAEMERLVTYSGGGAFLLFTSYAALNFAVNELAATFRGQGRQVLVQGELPKLEIAKRFASDGHAVLFGTKSFFEGVSIDGMALRLVVIDKLPFAAPSPLSEAIDRDLQRYAREELGMGNKDVERYPFLARAVPEMVIDLKQGAGRLIRTTTDKGVMAVLDNRLRMSQYGRTQALPALPDAPLVSHVQAVGDFFREIERARILAEMEAKRTAQHAKDTAMLIERRTFVEDEEGQLWA